MKVRNELRSKELKELKIRKCPTGFVRITEMEFRNNFGCMFKFISQNL
jgi:hypothetical protein